MHIFVPHSLKRRRIIASRKRATFIITAAVCKFPAGGKRGDWLIGVQPLRFRDRVSCRAFFHVNKRIFKISVCNVRVRPYFSDFVKWLEAGFYSSSIRTAQRCNLSALAANQVDAAWWIYAKKKFIFCKTFLIFRACFTLIKA